MQQKGLDVAYDEAPVIVETYIEGPEVDVNFMFWDGPPGGRVEKEHFGLQGLVFPSGLPPDEVEMLKKDVLAIVRQLGVCSGVVHAEAKVHNSVEWHTGDDGVQDLRPRVGAGGAGPGEEARTFLLEVNVRFPGTMDLTGSYLVNGVDFYSLSIAHAVGDEARFRSLAVGYRNRPLYQFGYTLLRLSTPSGGRMPGHLGLDKVGLDDHYMLHWQYWSAGEVVPEPGERPWPGLGFIYWRSTKSRRDLMEKVAIARRDLDVQLIVE